MKETLEPWIKLEGTLSREDYILIAELQEQCISHDHTALKLELDYKLGVTSGCASGPMKSINEFMYFCGNKLVGYLGICSFGGARAPLEANGMVHPGYRRRGVFSLLSDLAIAEWRRRGSGSMLLLCDRRSVSGQGFIERIGARYKHSEYEMRLDPKHRIPPAAAPPQGIALRKAGSEDVREIARQDAVYFGGSTAGLEDAPRLRIPEEEERRGMTIYLAERGGQPVGKVHVQTSPNGGGIYGLGVLPEHRGKGFGRAILGMAVDRLREADAGEIILQVASENATALSLYRSCGFVVMSTMDYYELRRR